MRSIVKHVASGAALAASLLLAPHRAHADAPLPTTWAVPDPGRSVAGASSDDSSAIAVNPANLAFQQEWGCANWVWTGSAAPLPSRGHSFALSVPIWMLATGLRVDLMDPPQAAAAPFGDNSQWIRWGLALRGGDAVALGTTLGWSSSDDARLDDHFSLTSGLTIRPATFLSLAAVARNWNEPVSRSRVYTLERSFDLGIALRPTSRRGFEIGLEAIHETATEQWTPRATLGIDIPRIGRLRGDLTLLEPDDNPEVVAMAGLDLNAALAPELSVSGGGVFGDAVTRSGSGFYAGLAIRGWREPGLVLPGHMARIRIEECRARAGTCVCCVASGAWPRTPRRSWCWWCAPSRRLLARAPRSATPSASCARGKKVICHLEDAGGRSLHVCSQADRITMNPAGGLRFAGISAQYFYFGGLLDKLGVRADFVRIGAHKLAAEQFTRSGGSPIGREDHQDLVNQYESVFLHDVGGGRRIPAVELKRRIATGPFLAREAQAAGLIDQLAYEDEIDRVVEEVLGHSTRTVDDEPLPAAKKQWGNAPKVALIYLAGDMIDGDSQYVPFLNIRLAGSYTIGKALKRAREDASIKSVVFRIETGGGSSLAADVILREAILTARKKPLIISMGSAAASGGYYASMAGGPIFANRSTVTGSIGIFYGKVDLQQLLGKVGVNLEAYRSAPRADAESLFRPFTDDEHRELGVKVKQFYDLFIARVSEGRRMPPAQVDAVARGRVWTGAQAKDRGLVDRIGGLREALGEARARGNLAPDAPIVEMPDDNEGLLSFLLDMSGLSAAGTGAAMATALVPPALLDLARSLAPFFVFDERTPLAR
ncbi:MAG: S49 family peptidase, partial [Polyangiaceae bacterium]